MLWHLALEPFEKRYTADWYRWFRSEYEKHGVEYQYVDGISLTDKIEVGRFLDVYNTIHWKMTQLAAVSQLFRNGKVKAGDIFFSTDLWHPGIESILYMSQLAKIPVRLFGILHAGTYDEHDFTAQAGLERWARHSEASWLTAAEKVFVGSEFHKNLLSEKRGFGEKIVVTGLPFYGHELREKYKGVKKHPGLVVFPHRNDPEKSPELFDKLKSALKDSALFVKTSEACKTKDDYYRLLATASVAISYADQETFGYAMLEAAALGCSIVVPNRLSYTNMYPRYSRFDTFEESVGMVRYCLAEPQPIASFYWDQYSYSIETILVYMGLIDWSEQWNTIPF